MNSNNICIKEDFVSYPSIDENEDIYENEDDLLDFTENETDGLYVSKIFVLWQEVTIFLNDFCLQKGFGYRKGYLKQLYESKESWARCYTSSYFTAGMQSINRIESINEVIKKDLDGRYVSLNDLCANIDNEIRIHVTFAITEKIHEQMNLSFLYHAIQIEYNTIDINIKFSYENRCINEIFDLPQGYANAILRDIYDQLVSIWEVRHMKYESSPNYIFLLEN
ncbi:11055_t:CDS:2, partial [Funneliformis geosporum]